MRNFELNTHPTPIKRTMPAVDQQLWNNLAKILTTSADESHFLAHSLSKDDTMRAWYEGREEMARQCAQLIKDRIY